MRSDHKKLDYFTSETSKNHLIRNFLRNGRLRVKLNWLRNVHIAETNIFFVWSYWPPLYLLGNIEFPDSIETAILCIIDWLFNPVSCFVNIAQPQTCRPDFLDDF